MESARPLARKNEKQKGKEKESLDGNEEVGDDGPRTGSKPGVNQAENGICSTKETLVSSGPPGMRRGHGHYVNEHLCGIGKEAEDRGRAEYVLASI